MDWSRTHLKNYLRTLLVLGRVSNLPTVWSNCLAGWWVAGGVHWGRLFLLSLGASFLYLGGMFLNDAFDAERDRRHRPERPIPSGLMKVDSVWQWGFSWLVLGLLCFGLLGPAPLFWAVFLTATILLYDAIHRAITFAPVIMGVCRGLLILTAAAVTERGINGYSIWVGLVLAAYVGGLSALARRSEVRRVWQLWPYLLTLAPLVLAWVVNRGPYQPKGLLLTFLVLLWLAASLRHLYLSYQPSVGRAVSDLLAGIVLVDLLATGGSPFGLGVVFLIWFFLALTLQRLIPAT